LSNSLIHKFLFLFFTIYVYSWHDLYNSISVIAGSRFITSFYSWYYLGNFLSSQNSRYIKTIRTWYLCKIFIVS